MENIQDLSSGKMSPVPSPQTRVQTSKRSLSPYVQSKPIPFLSLSLRKANGQEQDTLMWQMDSILPGEQSMLSIGEYPREEDVSILSQILVADAPEKYYLSQKACLGILRRASARGKELPELLNSEESLGETGSTICLNDQGGNRMDVTEDVTCTLRAESHHPPLVFENHSQDSRYTEPLDVAQTVLSTFGTGGNNQPFVVQTPKTLKIRSGCEGGGKGALIQENLSATLSCNNDQTVFVPVAYGICAKDSNSMRSDNPKSGFYEADTSRCLDQNGGNPNCNQGGIAVVSVQGSMIGRKDENGPLGDGINEDVSFTLNTIDRHAVAYGIDRAAFNQGKNAQYGFAVEEETQPTMVAKGPGAVAAPTFSSSKASFFTSAEEELANTLVATDWKDPPVVNDIDADLEYIVRRLTPTECARLQGFPDWWCDGLGTKVPSEEELQTWMDIFETWRLIEGKSSKPKTKKQVFKWLQNPHSDSAEYKMWGNGVALPNVCFVLSGIVYYTQNPPEI